MENARCHGDDWGLGDGEVRHCANPHSFFIPSEAVRNSLRDGDLVRLLFEFAGSDPAGPNAERMWVEVAAKTGDGYVGVLTNQPRAIQDLQLGDRVRFEPRHVIAIYDEEREQYANAVAFVNVRLLVDDALRPGYVVFEPSDIELKPGAGGARPSGWQLLVGDESEDELSDPAAVRSPNLGWLMERYPAFGKLARAGVTAPGGWVLSADGTMYEPEP